MASLGDVKIFNCWSGSFGGQRRWGMISSSIRNASNFTFWTRGVLKFFWSSIFLLCSCGQESALESGINPAMQQKISSSEIGREDAGELKRKQKALAEKQDKLLEDALNGDAQNKRGELAKSVQLRPSYAQCIEKSEGVHPAMISCNSEEHQYQDARLNKVYLRLLAKLAVQDKAALKQEERDWIEERDVLCQSNGVLGGGQAEELEDSSCMLNATAKRADELENR
ncbi:lysozyme inhibitor LprI family protein [Xanthomonas campestris pv. raphani]|uniref:lysozyme inhibitor LprI family protein n=2 Tax=Xanthomonas campestris TaxID=339 RepID=UPI002B22A9BB|nr:lysozyme inhibitor LprI family protein [Xanthomonas campestris]MEA9915171.1 lysozyme inhibitor LprI family protein [Xanthomonas campestris pv. raphani]